MYDTMPFDSQEVMLNFVLSLNLMKLLNSSNLIYIFNSSKGPRGRDRMVVGFLPVQSMSITTNVVSSNHVHNEVYYLLCDKVSQ